MPTARTPPAPAGVALPGMAGPGAGFDEPFAMLAACHERVQRSLDLLGRLLDHLDHLGQTALDEAARSAAGDVWRYFNIAAPAHHADEERHVVPWLLASADPALQQAGQQMLDDHRAFHALWQQLGPLLLALQAGTAPVGDTLRTPAQAFIQRHAGHLRLEDGLAFPARQQAMATTDQAAMGAEMAQRRGVARPR